MENVNYVRIDFENCHTDYDYTICPWNDIKNQLQIAEFAIIEAEKSEYEKYGEPKIIITPCFMTEKEYKKWYKEIEDNA